MLDATGAAEFAAGPLTASSPRRKSTLERKPSFWGRPIEAATLVGAAWPSSFLTSWLKSSSSSNLSRFWREHRGALASCAGLCLVQSAATVSQPLFMLRFMLWLEQTAACEAVIPGAQEGGAGVGVGFGLALIAATGVSVGASHAFRTASTAVGVEAQRDAVLRAFCAACRVSAAASGVRSSSAPSAIIAFAHSSSAIVPLFGSLIALALLPLEVLVLLATLGVVIGWATAVFAVTVSLFSSMLVRLAEDRSEEIFASEKEAIESRMHVIDKVILQMRAVKCATLGRFFETRVNKMRSHESSTVLERGHWFTLTCMASDACVDVISVIVVVYITQGPGSQLLTPALLFTLWCVLGILHGRLLSLPQKYVEVVSGLATFRNLDGILDPITPPSDANLFVEQTKRPSANLRPSGNLRPLENFTTDALSTLRVLVHEADFRWPPKDPTTAPTTILRGVSFELPPGSLGILTGPTGSGKSTLLAGLLGELGTFGPRASFGALVYPCLTFSGVGFRDEVEQPITIGLAAQQPVVFAASIQSNILLGLPLIQSRYDAVLHACCLDEIVGSMPDRDDAIVGRDTPGGLKVLASPVL